MAWNTLCSAIIPGIIRHFRKIVKKKERERERERQAPVISVAAAAVPPYIYICPERVNYHLLAAAAAAVGRRKKGEGGPAGLRQSVNSRARLPLKKKEDEKEERG